MSDDEYTPSTDALLGAWQPDPDDSTTPTTDEVRARWVEDPDACSPSPLLEGRFDRWLLQHDRQVAARALRDFRDRVYNGAPDPYQAFYNEGLAPLLDAEADRIEAGEVP